MGASLLRVRRQRRNLLFLRLQLLADDLDRLVELLVVAGELAGGIIVNDKVRVDAVALDDPLLAVKTVARELRPVQEATVQERQRAADADHSSPAPLADQLAQLVRPELE